MTSRVLLICIDVGCISFIDNERDLFTDNSIIVLTVHKGIPKALNGTSFSISYYCFIIYTESQRVYNAVQKRKIIGKKSKVFTRRIPQENRCQEISPYLPGLIYQWRQVKYCV